MKRLGTTLLVLLPALASMPALADGGIEITRGPDSTVYGNCVPSLSVENRSAETIDYLEVDLVLTLADGRQRTVELASAYHEGVLTPIVAGGTATLKQHLDTSRAIGVQCSEVGQRAVRQTICEVQGKACAAGVSVTP
jgi:hypothetical protein